MALPEHPSRELIYIELDESTYRDTGMDSPSLKNMYNYVFGNNDYSREEFGGLGIPLLDNDIILTEGDQEIEVEYDLANKGIPSGQSVTIVAQYWEHTTEIPDNPCSDIDDSFQQIDTVTSEGIHTATISGLNNGIEYDVRLLAYNLFNNNGNHTNICAFESDDSWDFTGIAQATPEDSQYSTPGISRSEVADVDNGLYIDVGATGNQDSIEVQYRINGGEWNFVAESSYDSHSGLGGSSPEICLSMDTFVEDGSDTVEVEVRSVGSSDADSNWSNTDTAIFDDLSECPV